ncbi:MAG: SPFH domain-containing protein [Chloroflexota bacterium]
MSKRRQRRSIKNRASRSELGWVGLALAGVIMATFGSILADYTGLRYELMGGFVWTFFLLVSFFMVLLYFAQFVLPLGEEGESWLEGLDMIWRHYRLRGDLFLNQFMNPVPEKVKEEKGALPLSFKKLQAGFVPSHQALAIVRNNQHTRAAGPGFVMLAKGEQVKEMIDLRPHTRSQTIKANTRDGIPIETIVGVTFQVRRQPANQSDDRRPYPYDREAIFHVSYLYSMHEGEKRQPWTEQVCPRAAALVVDKLARFTLDQLYNGEQNGRLLLQEIAEGTKQSLAEWLTPRGIELLGVGVGHLQPPDKVKEQRVRSWQAGWERKIKVQEGRQQAEVLRYNKLKRAQAQIEIVNNILESIDAIRYVEDADLSEIIMLRMVEVLEETAQDALVRKLLPEQALSKLVKDTSGEMRRLLRQSDAEKEEEAAEA